MRQFEEGTKSLILVKNGSKAHNPKVAVSHPTPEATSEVLESERCPKGGKLDGHDAGFRFLGGGSRF